MSKFPVLTAVSGVMRFLGWLLIVLGVAAMAYGLLGSSRFGAFGGFELVVIGGVFGILNGLFVVAAGESIGVLFAIEANTREAASRVQG